MPPNELSDDELRSAIFSRIDGEACQYTDRQIFEETSRRAENGNKGMRFMLGTLHYRGIGTETDADAADEAWVSSFEDAVEGLQTIAYSHYAGSLGLDLKRAGNLFCRAADSGGDDYLLLRAADCYLAEYMESRDDSMGVLAFNCYRNAFPDYADSWRGLALCYMYGIGTEVSYPEAEHILYAAENDGTDVTDMKMLLGEIKHRGYYFK